MPLYVTVTVPVRGLGQTDNRCGSRRLREVETRIAFRVNATVRYSACGNGPVPVPTEYTGVTGILSFGAIPVDGRRAITDEISVGHGTSAQCPPRQRTWIGRPAANQAVPDEASCPAAAQGRRQQLAAPQQQGPVQQVSACLPQVNQNTNDPLAAVWSRRVRDDDLDWAERR